MSGSEDDTRARCTPRKKKNKKHEEQTRTLRETITKKSAQKYTYALLFFGRQWQWLWRCGPLCGFLLLFLLALKPSDSGFNVGFRKTRP